MNEKAESESRRRLLKQLAAGGGVAVTAKSLPESWTKPVVNSVLLPAHARTTGEEPSCWNCGSRTVNNTDDQDASCDEILDTKIVLDFDPASGCNLRTGDEGDNTLIRFDSDCDQNNWDAPGDDVGVNWERYFADFNTGSQGNNASGTGFTARFARVGGGNTGRCFEVTFDVEVIDGVGTTDMTVSNVEICEIACIE